MEGKEVKFNRNLYNVFSICEDFRQRLEQLHRLTEKLVDSKVSEEDKK